MLSIAQSEIFKCTLRLSSNSMITVLMKIKHDAADVDVTKLSCSEGRSGGFFLFSANH